MERFAVSRKGFADITRTVISIPCATSFRVMLRGRDEALQVGPRWTSDLIVTFSSPSCRG